MMKNNIEVLIIGAGISGLSIAYHLASKGQKNILVVDQGYFVNGATGRCGAGVRQQWGSELNCILAKKSIEFFEKANQILEYEDDLQFKQEGYLILATTESEVETFKANVALQNSLGIPSYYCDKAQALAIVPHLNPDSFIGATFCQSDGHLNPFKMSEAFYLAAKRYGVQFSFYEEVTAIETKDKKIVSVTTNKASYHPRIVVNAAGGYSQKIGELAQVDIPVFSENHEILVTEPVSKMQGPMVMSFSRNIYCQQVPHGPFIMGRSDPDVEVGINIDSTWKFLDEMAKTAVHILPPLANLRVVRQWGGMYNISLDRLPILSDTDQCEGFYIACGFSGHGFMLAPMTGLLMSELILNQPTTIDMKALHLDRFKQHSQPIEHSVV